MANQLLKWACLMVVISFEGKTKTAGVFALSNSSGISQLSAGSLFDEYVPEISYKHGPLIHGSLNFHSYVIKWKLRMIFRVPKFP